MTAVRAVEMRAAAAAAANNKTKQRGNRDNNCKLGQAKRRTRVVKRRAAGSVVSRVAHIVWVCVAAVLMMVVVVAVLVVVLVVLVMMDGRRCRTCVESGVNAARVINAIRGRQCNRGRGGRGRRGVGVVVVTLWRRRCGRVVTGHHGRGQMVAIRAQAGGAGRRSCASDRAWS